MSQEKINYPIARKSNQTDNYFGTIVPDPYRWMEDVDSTETLEWIKQQEGLTEDFLSRIPFREKIRKRLREIWDYPKYSAPFRAGEYYFFNKNDGLQNQSILYRQKGLDGKPEVFLDPNTFSDDGTISLQDISVSRDSKYLAYTVSRSGSDWIEINVMEISTGRKLDDQIKWAKFSGANWYKDGFFYSTFDIPKSGNRYTKLNEFQKVYYHKLGTEQSADTLIYEDRLNPKRSHAVWSDEDEKYLFLWVGEQGQRGNSLYFKKGDGPETERPFVPIVRGFEHIYWSIETIDNKFYMLTNKDAPKFKVVKIDLDNTGLPWETVVAESAYPISMARLAGGKLILTYMKDVIEHVYIYSPGGSLEHEVTMPGAGSVMGFEGKKMDKQLFYEYTSMSCPLSVYRYDIDRNQSMLFNKPEVEFEPDDYESKQVFYTSKDGTRVPMFIVHKRGLKKDGTNPTFLYAYGGFNVNMQPSFSTARIVLLENGGVMAIPNLRGGGEYGEKWHEGGMLNNKQNVFDDFIAAAEYLIKEGYTSPDYLAAAGGSNGGLLIGAVENQRPDLFKVCFPAVGVMDMLRFHKFTIGASWVTEYGSSDNESDFRNLYEYSPVHNISGRINYPATLVTTADHDDRVVPSHSFKYIATLQEKYTGPNPVLLRIESKAGHGHGTSMTKLIEENTDMWAFMFHSMGIEPKY